MRKRTGGLTPEVAEVFRRYSWPGNVRELRNVIERLLILEDHDMITTTYLPQDLVAEPQATAASEPDADIPQPPTAAPRTDPVVPLPADGVPLDEVEMSLVRQALERSGGNQTRAAELLRISRGQLRYRLKKLEEAKAND